MKKIFACITAFILLLVSGWADDADQSAAVTTTNVVVADARDREVMETALLHLLSDTNFNLTSTMTNDAVIMLHTRNPEKTGMIRAEQMQGDIGKEHKLAEDLQKDLLHRNGKEGSYDSIPASYSGLKFDERIVVTDLTGKLGGPLAMRAFETGFSKARAWMEAYLPGYSKDGTAAVVRGWVGPTSHGAVVTVFLEKNGDKWSVKWHHVAYFL